MYNGLLKKYFMFSKKNKCKTQIINLIIYYIGVEVITDDTIV